MLIEGATTLLERQRDEAEAEYRAAVARRAKTHRALVRLGGDVAATRRRGDADAVATTRERVRLMEGRLRLDDVLADRAERKLRSLQKKVEGKISERDRFLGRVAEGEG
jgi:hypothetical protein